MKSSFRLFIFMLMVMGGCVSVFYLSVQTVSAKAPSPSPAEQWLRKAEEDEKRGELQRALFYLKIAATIEPTHQGVEKKATQITQKAKKLADQHYQKGVVFARKRQKERAQREFLTALRYHPDHAKALDYLKNKLRQKPYTAYTVKKRDTFVRIARKVYNDRRKAFLVARFNDLSPKTKPKPGDALKLPVIEKEPERGEINALKELKTAQKYFDKRQYQKVLPIVEKILKNDPYHEQADEMKNVSYYQLGKQYHQKKEYNKSLRMYRRVDPEYEIVETAITKVQEEMYAEAEDHYRKGIKHFVNDRFRAAILEWAKTLTLNPNHEKAKKDIEKARNILKKLETNE